MIYLVIQHFTASIVCQTLIKLLHNFGHIASGTKFIIMITINKITFLKLK